MRDDVTRSEMTEQLQRLAASFGKPYGVAVERQAEEWTGGFRRVGIPAVALRAAVDEVTLTLKKFPSLAELISVARTHTPQTDGERQGQSDRCPQCRGLYEWRPTDTLGKQEWVCGCQYPAMLVYARQEWLEERRGERFIDLELQRRTDPKARCYEIKRPKPRPAKPAPIKTGNPQVDRLGEKIAAKRELRPSMTPIQEVLP